MKTPKTFNLPKVSGRIPNKKPELPIPINVSDVHNFTYSFYYLDREHPLFNLGEIKDGWFLDLLDCLKEASKKTIPELKAGKFKLHPIDWTRTNVDIPNNYIQQEFWQFRLSKGNGRVIGFKIESVFYVVWLDPHHNLIDSEGYGSYKEYNKPKTEYEELLEKCETLNNDNISLKQAFECCDPFNCPLKAK